MLSSSEKEKFLNKVKEEVKKVSGIKPHHVSLLDDPVTGSLIVATTQKHRIPLNTIRKMHQELLDAFSPQNLSPSAARKELAAIKDTIGHEICKLVERARKDHSYCS